MKTSKIVRYKEPELLFCYKWVSTFFNSDTAWCSKSFLFLYPHKIYCNSSLTLTEAWGKKKKVDMNGCGFYLPEQISIYNINIYLRDIYGSHASIFI